MSIPQNSTHLSNKPIILWIHDPSTNHSQDAILNPDMFPNFCNGQLLKIYYSRHSNNMLPSQQQQSSAVQNNTNKKDTISQQSPPPQQQSSQNGPITSSNDYNETVNLYLDHVIVKGHTVDRESITKQPQLQVSISKDLADRFNFRSRQEVHIELIDPQQVALDYVELAFKDQYLGRSDMWRLQQSLRGTCVYHEKKILFAGSIKATVKRLFVNDDQTTSGYITKTTRMVFRSASAKFFLFIQMSKEMWEFDEDGELYFEKAVSSFLPQLFNRWREEGTNHVVSIVLFTRVHYEFKFKDSLLMQSSDGRYYKDFYKVMADWETTDDWMTVIGSLKKEQLNFQQMVLLRTENNRQELRGRISISADGNILEAINLALNPFDMHYVDRDLMRTGLSIILITPGVGKFWVNKKLLRLTNERMTDNGIAMDLVCLSPLPLHITPLMCYKDAPFVGENDNHVQLNLDSSSRGVLGKNHTVNGNSPEKTNIQSNPHQKPAFVDPLYLDSNDAPTQTYYTIPHWVDCSFYHHETGRFIKQDKFKTSCKMFELQMMGIMEHDICDISIPYLTKITVDDSTEVTRRPIIKQHKSYSSLNEKLIAGEKSGSYSNNTGEPYLSTSANMSSFMRRSPIFMQMEKSARQPLRYSGEIEKPVDAYTSYDNNIFKTTLEPTFNKRIMSGTLLHSNKSIKSIHSFKNVYDSIEQSDQNTSNDGPSLRSKSSMTWHPTNEQRRVLSQSQRNKSPLENQYLCSHKEDKSIMDQSKVSPKYIEKGDPDKNRKNGINGIDGKNSFIASSLTTYCIQQQIQHQNQFLQVTNSSNNHDGDFVSGSSTVDPVPINSKGLSIRSETIRKPSSHSPQQGVVSVSISSSANTISGDTMNTGFEQMNNTSNRFSLSHPYSRSNPLNKSNLINPCNPSANQTLFTSHIRRWDHALPVMKENNSPVVHWKSITTPACLPLTTDYFPSNEELSSCYNHYMYTVSASEDTNLYQSGDRDLSEHIKTENLLIEMLYQRLAQGFQIIVDDTGNLYYPKSTPSKNDNAISFLHKGLGKKDDNIAATFGKSWENGSLAKRSSGSLNIIKGGYNHTDTNITNLTKHFANSKLVNTNNPTTGKGTQNDFEKTRWKPTVWWLSMGHQVHQLTFDSSGQNVEVRRYVRTKLFDDSKVDYKCAIWPKNMPTYRPKDVAFNYPNIHYQWNYLDHLVAGYQDELTDNLRFWRTRFIVIPRETLPTNITITNASHDNLNEEEKRLALFEYWIFSIRRAKWLTPEEREEMKNKQKREAGFSELGIKLTTMDPSVYVASDYLKASHTNSAFETRSGNTILSLSCDSKSKDIALALQDPKYGVPISDRRWHTKVFHLVFTGTELCDWLISQIDDIATRESAIRFGNALMKRKPPVIVSAINKHVFLDGNCFYRLHEEFVISKRRRSKFNARKSYSSNESGTNSTLSTAIREKDAYDTNLRKTPSSQSTISISQPVNFEMSQAMIIDIDPYKKSDRRETAILHYDTIHNPRNCYHFQLNWLGCTAQLVQELVQNWSRQAERCGLKLVEGSVDQAFEDSENNNPFQCPVPISMAVPPPPVDELISLSKINIPAQFYEIALVHHLDFVLDVEADVNFERAKSKGVKLEYTFIKEVFKHDQYIHRSGVSFIQIRPNGEGFYWVNNRLYANHVPTIITNRRQPSLQDRHPDALRIEFQQYCNDSKWLSEFWETTKNNFLSRIECHDSNNNDSSFAWLFDNLCVSVDTDSYFPMINPSISEDSTSISNLLLSPSTRTNSVYSNKTDVNNNGGINNINSALNETSSQTDVSINSSKADSQRMQH